MVNYLALLGWNDGTENEVLARDELVEAFDIDRIVKGPSVFGMDKLKWVNSQHLKKIDAEEILDLVLRWPRVIILLRLERRGEAVLERIGEPVVPLSLKTCSTSRWKNTARKS